MESCRFQYTLQRIGRLAHVTHGPCPCRSVACFRAPRSCRVPSPLQLSHLLSIHAGSAGAWFLLLFPLRCLAVYLGFRASVRCVVWPNLSRPRRNCSATSSIKTIRLPPDMCARWALQAAVSFEGPCNSVRCRLELHGIQSFFSD
jgi:hypothetical protein